MIMLTGTTVVIPLRAIAHVIQRSLFGLKEDIIRFVTTVTTHIIILSVLTARTATNITVGTTRTTILSIM